MLRKGISCQNDLFRTYGPTENDYRGKTVDTKDLRIETNSQFSYRKEEWGLWIYYDLSNLGESQHFVMTSMLEIKKIRMQKAAEENDKAELRNGSWL